MFAKYLGAGIAYLVAVSLTGVSRMMLWEAEIAPTDRTTSTLVRTLTRLARREGGATAAAWAITKATSAHQALVLDVEADHLEHALDIAMQIVEPVRTRDYEEILIYVRQPERREPAVRRIQWTPRGGYVEMTYSER
ncbi:MAG: hypothetical protein EXQ59_00685 [Acidobacteria bacterium]|nr:hypothetical protein [Acidobacteriota bacterium]